MSHSKKTEWRRVTREKPCRICEKLDWCTVCEDGACCMRIDSQTPMRNGGYFHRFDEPIQKRDLPIADKSQLLQVKPDFGKLISEWREKEVPERMPAIAENLGLPETTLRMLGVTWCPYSRAMAFPMFDAAADVACPCGIRLRTMGGAKFAIKHSKSGIFFPYGALLTVPMRGRIYVCEGPTDTAACLAMGIFAIGRASCRGGEDIVLSVLSQLCPAECVVISDNDGPGVEGAKVLMEKIKIRKARIVPPGKDVRAFVRDGGTREVLDLMLKDTFWR